MNDEPTNEPTPETIEGSGELVTAAARPAVSQTSVVAAPTARPSREVLVPLDPERVIEGMRAYQDLLPKLLDASDYQGTGSDAFVKKSGWRKIARAFNLSVEIVSISIERDADGNPERAECIARATAPNGQVQDADGYCSISEFTGRRAKDSKLENTLRATATTRAKNRAIADLVGMGEVSAEEVTEAELPPPFGPAITPEEKPKASAALAFLLDDDAERIWNEIRDEAGYFPLLVGTAIRKIARVLAERNAEAVAARKAEAERIPGEEELPWDVPDSEPPDDADAEAGEAA